MPDKCGAFFHDYVAAKYLMKRGHTVHFVYTQTQRQTPYTGIYRGVPYLHYMKAEEVLKNSDIWTTPHYPIVPTVRKLNEKFQKPLVMTVHFADSLKCLLPYDQSGKWAESVFYVSNHMKNYVERAVPTMASSIKKTNVLYPIMLESDIKLPEDREEGKYITLVNGNLLKGVDVFLKIANEMPDHEFLGIRAYYSSTQVHNTNNVTWNDYSDDIRPALAKTRVLIVPSTTESWSRIAFEAMYNGIPVIYSKPYETAKHPGGTTHAIHEWVGDAAIQCDRTKIKEWIDALTMLDDPDVYNEWSIKAREKALSLDMFRNVEKYEQFLVQFSREFPPIVESNKSINPQTSASAARISQVRQPMMTGAPQRLSILSGRFGAGRRVR